MSTKSGSSLKWSPGVDVPILGGHHHVVAVLARQQFCYLRGDGVPAFHGQGAALAEGGLHVHDEQGCAVVGALFRVLSHIWPPAPRLVPLGAAPEAR